MKRVLIVIGLLGLVPLTLATAQVPAAPAAPATPALHLDVSLAQGRATVGDRIEVLLTLRLPAAQLAGEPRFPAWGKGWGDTEVVEKGPAARISESDGTAVYRQRIVVTPWQPGRVPLPRVAAVVPFKSATVQAESPGNLALTVASVLPPKKEGEKDPPPKPAAPPRPLPLGAPFGWSALALAAACLGAGYLLWRRGRKAAPVAAVPALAPLAELLAGLDRLAGEPSVRLHTRLSLALRTYLGRTLAFPAAESTTSEIHRRLLARQLPAPLVRRTFELLRACDLVKFARQEVGETVSRERLGAAREIGGEVESYLAPKAEEPLEKAG
ncbi:MAG: hypothetical protein QOJ16_4299 [Acidobacteriota bacterium]|jgi:hypothetical protein|nr:hypothetical protein [Acidobacteriota bacterium]